MKINSLSKKELLIWSGVLLWTVIIYLTIPLAAAFRKSLTEKFGYGIYDHLFWIFGAVALGCLFFILKHPGRNIVVKLTGLAVIAGIYVYWLLDLRYPVERVHLLEYGILGALVFTGLMRRTVLIPAWVLTANICYWIGLGDEYIQFLLPDRVGEISDSVLNFFSAVLGVFVIIIISPEPDNSSRHISPGPVRMCFISLALTVCLTAAFLYSVHGFGFKHENKFTGNIYSSLTVADFKNVNEGNPVNKRISYIYQNEAARHLHQREYYCINDFLGRDGTYYRQWKKCHYENEILETWYSQFLLDNIHKDAGSLIHQLDPQLSKKVSGNPVKWDRESQKAGSGKRFLNYHYTSRVKSTIITSFNEKDLLFYSFLCLVFLFWLYRVTRKAVLIN